MPKLAILLAVYNGAAHLAEQLDSYAAQDETDWQLWVSDDGSTDGSREIVARFAAARPKDKVKVVEGPRQGSAMNFRHLLKALPPDMPRAAFSDQDDVWLPHKLTRALRALDEVPQEVPAIYCSRTIICDEDLRPRRPSRIFRRPPGFCNALVQNIAAGNTIVFNPAALRLVRAANAEAAEVTLHDWWVYQIVTGAGGQVISDAEPGLLYRQHDGNLVGANNGLRALLVRLAMMLNGRYSVWNSVNIAALSASAHRLTGENRAILHHFARARQSRLPRRLVLLARAGLYRQTPLSQAGFWLAALLGRI
ncbi:MAG TPA: glycosyltransferase family 2 protein [Paracoccaceae bacterium]